MEKFSIEQPFAWQVFLSFFFSCPVSSLPDLQDNRCLVDGSQRRSQMLLFPLWWA
jgi:hypothetical protein